MLRATAGNGCAWREGDEGQAPAMGGGATTDLDNAFSSARVARGVNAAHACAPGVQVRTTV
jgi:hypothetical protein